MKTSSKKKKKFKIPKYVAIKDGRKFFSYMRLMYIEGWRVYYRDAGDWACPFTVKDGKLFVNGKDKTNQRAWEWNSEKNAQVPSDKSVIDHLHGMELVPVSEKSWRRDNRGYL